ARTGTGRHQRARAGLQQQQRLRTGRSDGGYAAGHRGRGRRRGRPPVRPWRGPRVARLLRHGPRRAAGGGGRRGPVGHPRGTAAGRSRPGHRRGHRDRHPGPRPLTRRGYDEPVPAAQAAHSPSEMQPSQIQGAHMAPRQTARRLLIAVPAVALTALATAACSPPNEQPADADAPYTLPTYSEENEATSTQETTSPEGAADESEGEQVDEGMPGEGE